MTLVKLQEDLFIPDNFSEDHRYLADEKGEKEYTGITTVLRIKSKDALIPWAVKMACEYIDGFIKEVAVHADWPVLLEEGKWDEVVAEAKKAHIKKKEAAGTHGTSMHGLVEEWIKMCLALGKGKPMDSSYPDAVEKFVLWSVENVDHFLYAERPVHSRKLWLAGTIDFGAVMKDGSRRVCDLKTGNGIFYEAILQAEFYQILAEEEGDEPYDGSVIVNMKKDGGFETQTRARSEIDREAALGALALYRGDKSFIKPKNTTWKS